MDNTTKVPNVDKTSMYGLYKYLLCAGFKTTNASATVSGATAVPESCEKFCKLLHST